jgi:[ribosomal protein S5]-alanine N-acetyltransferase
MIKTKKFILRRFRMSDAGSIVRHANDKLVARYLERLPHPYTLKDAKVWLGKKLKEYKQKNPKEFVFAIDIDGEAVGAIGFHKIIHGHKAEMGYWLGKKYWGRGFMTEIVKHASQYAIKAFKLRRLQAYTFPFNKASMRVLEKNGFKLEGILRKEIKKDNKFLDAHVYAKVV